MYARLARHPVTHATLFVVYLLFGRLGVFLEKANVTAAAAVWPPSGFTLAAFVLFGRPIWPAIALGSFFVRFVGTGEILQSIPIALGNTLTGFVGASLLNKFAGGADSFSSPRQIFRFAAIVALATTIGATVQAIVVNLPGPIPWVELPTTWLLAWLVRLSGALVFAPLLLLWATDRLCWPRWATLLEITTLVAMLTWVGLLVFAGLFPSDIKNYPLEFLCVPFFLWAAFRFGRREVATAMALLSVIAVWGTLHGFGPFVRDTQNQNESLVLLQAYTSVMAMMGLILAASIGEHKQAEAQLHQLATTDPLTGLANYRRLLEVLRSEIARSGRTRRSFAVLFVDMNGLKRVNDRYGHLTGSRALCRVADALRQASRAIDTPARFGGDEFAIVLPETTHDGGERVLERVSEVLSLDSTTPRISVTGGVAVFPDDGETPTVLLRAADRKLYDAKAKSMTARRDPSPRSRRSERRGVSGSLF
jgi:diguanylate cyclase (GGDEF)-like protein